MRSAIRINPTEIARIVFNRIQSVSFMGSLFFLTPCWLMILLNYDSCSQQIRIETNRAFCEGPIRSYGITGVGPLLGSGAGATEQHCPKAAGRPALSGPFHPTSCIDTDNKATRGPRGTEPHRTPMPSAGITAYPDKRQGSMFPLAMGNVATKN